MPSLRNDWAALLVGFVLPGRLPCADDSVSFRSASPSLLLWGAVSSRGGSCSSSTEERRLTRRQPDLATPS